MMNAFILATSLAWASPQQAVYNNSKEEAIKTVGKAMYVELEINKSVNRLEKKYVPKIVKEYGTWPTLLIKIITEKKASYEWTF